MIYMVSNKWTPKRSNAGTPKVCKSPALPPPLPPLYPICDERNIFKVDGLGHYTYGGVTYEHAINLQLVWQPTLLRFYQSVHADGYLMSGNVTLNSIPPTCTKFNFQLSFAKVTKPNIQAQTNNIPCTGSTPRSWSFPPWTYFFKWSPTDFLNVVLSL